MAHILVVDDEPDFRDILCQSFEFAGHHVESAEDVATARQLIAEHPPDVVIADLHFPRGANGIELAKHLREGTNSGVPVIACSGHPDLLDVARSSGAFENVIEKPCQMQALMAAVDEVSHHRPSTGLSRPAE